MRLPAAWQHGWARYCFLHPDTELPISRAQEEMDSAARARDFWPDRGLPNMMVLVAAGGGGSAGQILIEGYIEGEVMQLRESRSVEFKSLAEPVRRGTKTARETVLAIIDRGYINAFLNSDGGVLYFGVEDSGEVRSRMSNGSLVAFTVKELDQIALMIDSKIKQYDPPVDDHLVRINFTPIGEPSSRLA